MSFRVTPGFKATLGAELVFLLYQKGRDSRIFQAQDRAIEDFTLKGKTKETIIDNLEFIC